MQDPNFNESSIPFSSDALPQRLPESYLSPSPTVTTAQNTLSPFLQNLMASVNMTAIPQHPTPKILQRSGGIQVEFDNLYLDNRQIHHIQAVYASGQYFSQLFTDSIVSQTEAIRVLGQQELDICQLKHKDLKDLGNCWSQRWSTKDSSGENTRECVLVQCIAAVQSHNREMCDVFAYDGQRTIDPLTANVRYHFLPQDSSHLYRMQARIQGVDLLQPPESNIDDWLDPRGEHYRPELAQAIFHYKACRHSSERFKICIHAEEM
ncbi:hypothetical protein M422DRAFT_247504 [Sphaerobolus stellatus SS14]|nr:hypothetical protein M422DRAFT_247504 [Sphaerobolus stellatus SS14]